MEKNQTITKDTKSQQGQGVCEKIFKALNLTSAFQYIFRNPKSKIATSDHHQRSDPARTTEFKLVVPQQDQNLSFASNKVHVEYNHSEVTMSKTELATSDHHQRSDPARTTKFNLVVPQQDQNLYFASNKVHVEYNHSEVTMSKTESPVHMLPEKDYSESARFSTYINHVKSKIMSSYDDDDDKHKHRIDPSKFDIRTTAIACGDQG
ncbi:hypothetical protein KY289_036887 [Solanum tuberosum]|nr:hypothetical protein KY284_036715 [Solanum tuberosum]KAH0636972.1 hypothetical protein KY289_036887 [Solanum tuberosum]